MFTIKLGALESEEFVKNQNHYINFRRNSP